MSKGIKAIVLYAIWMGLLTYGSNCAQASSDGGVLLIIICLTSMVFGWKVLAALPKPEIFVIMPICGWLLFFALKAMLCLFVGLFTTPYQIASQLCGEPAGA